MGTQIRLKTCEDMSALWISVYQVGTNFDVSQTFKARHFQNGDKFCKVGTFGQNGDVFMKV